MAEIKISDLNPKGSNLSVTDLLVISEDIGGGLYETKSITGDEVLSGKENSLPSIAGNALKVLRVNALETGKEWATISSGLTIGTTPITSGVAGRVLFEGAGNVVQEDSAFVWDNTNKRLGVGATPATTVRLDVRAQGALSTDIAFRVRNSADTQDLLKIQGNGGWMSKNNTGNAYLLYDGTSTYEFATPSQLFLQTNTSTPSFSIQHNGNSAGTYLALRTQSQSLFIYRNGNFYFGTSPQSGNGTNSFILENGTAPTINQADRCYQYSADITAGNAAPHFRTENGSVIMVSEKLGTKTNNTLTLATNDTDRVWLDTLGNLGVGSTPATTVRLDVRAQGALSTDIAFRVRNSADTQDLLKVQGDAGIVHNGRFGLNTATNAAIDLFINSGSASSYAIYTIGTYSVAGIASVPNTATTRHNFYAPACGFSGAYYAGNGGGTATVTGIRRGYVAENFNPNNFDNIAFTSNIANTGGGGAIAFDVVNGDFRFGTSTGTKIGTATSQKIAFWNTTPIVQPTTAITASTLISNLGTPLTDTDTFDGYNLQQVVKALKNIGILA